MKILNRLNDYLSDREFRITIYQDKKVDIINYDSIIDFNLNEVIVKTNDRKVIIEGLNLTINKMLDNEVLITGLISNIRIN